MKNQEEKPRKQKVERLYWIAAIAALLTIPLVSPLVDPYSLHIIIIIGMNVILALALNVIMGYVGMLSLAHATFFGVGAYASAILSVRYGSPYLLTLPASALLAAIVAYLIGIPALKLSRHSFGIVTFGFSGIAFLLVQNLTSVTNGVFGIGDIPAPTIINFVLASKGSFLFLISTILLASVFFFRLVTMSRIGRIWTAIRGDELLAESQGIDTAKYKLMAFVISAAFAGVVGNFYAYYVTYVSPETLLFEVTLGPMVMVLVGGGGHLLGVGIAAVVLTAVPEFLRVAGPVRDLSYGLALAIAITFLPQGFWGLSKKIWPRRNKSIVVT